MATTRKLLAFIDNLLAKCAWIRQLKKTRTLPKEKAYSRKNFLIKKNIHPFRFMRSSLSDSP